MERRNILILNVSLLFQINTSKRYPYDIDGQRDSVEGIQTNEAAAKCLLNLLGKEKLYKIIMLESSDVCENKIKDMNITTHEYLVAAITKYCEEKDFELPIFCPVKWDDLLGNSLTQIIKEIGNQNNADVYVDTTGGLRTQSDWINSVIQYLEYSEVKLKKTFYTNYDREHPENNKVICVKKDILNQLIKGAEEFTTSGKCENFVKLFKNSDDEDIRNLVEAMSEFSESMMLCRVNGIDDTIKKLKKSIQKISKSEYANEAEILLKNLAPIILDKLNIEKENRISDIIKWCIDNGFIQQALTIYEARIPKYIFDKKMIEIDDYYKQDKLYSEFKKLKGTFNDYNAWIFYNHILELCSKEDAMIKDFKQNLIIKYVDGGHANFLPEQFQIDSAFETVKSKLGNDITQKIAIDCEQSEYDLKAIEIYDFIISNSDKETHTDFAAIINSICNNKMEIRKILALPPKDKDAKTLNKLETISKMDCSLLPNQIKVTISPEKLKKIYYDYALIKTMRNTLNHALDGNKDLKLFKNYGYSKNQLNISVESISNQLINALDRIYENR